MNDGVGPKVRATGNAVRTIGDAVDESWQRLAGTGEPGEGRTIETQFLSSVRVLLTRSQGKVYATQAECGHMRFPLRDGKVEGPVLTCPLHKAQFDLSSGVVVRPPRIPWILRFTKVGKQMGLISCNALRTYEVEERPDGVYVRRRAPTS